jgi:hypothetical protein
MELPAVFGMWMKRQPISGRYTASAFLGKFSSATMGEP